MEPSAGDMDTRAVGTTTKVVAAGALIVVISFAVVVAATGGGGGGAGPAPETDANVAAQFNFDRVDDTTVEVTMTSGEQIRTDNIHIQGNGITASNFDGQHISPGDSTIVNVPDNDNWRINIEYTGSGSGTVATHSP